VKYETNFKVLSETFEETTFKTGQVIENPAETFDTFWYGRYLCLESPDELEGNFCNPDTYRRLASEFPNEKPKDIKGLRVRQDPILSDEGDLNYTIKYLFHHSISPKKVEDFRNPPKKSPGLRHLL
jgi:hypothetical protein